MTRNSFTARIIIFALGIMSCFWNACLFSQNANKDAQKGIRHPESFNVLSYNIHMWQIGVNDLAKVIRKCDADIVGLNEAWNEKNNRLLANELKFKVVFGGDRVDTKTKPKAHTVNGFYMPQVLLTKHKIVESKHFNAVASKPHKDFHDDVPVYRGATMALLETKVGNRIAVLVVHLHPWGDVKNEKMITMRMAELNGVLKKFQKYSMHPRIVLGDFNALSHLDGIDGWKVSKKMETEGYGDLFRDVYPDRKKHAGISCGTGRIDFIQYSRDFRPVSAKLVTDGVFGSKGKKDSDHLAVFGELKLIAK